MAQFSELSETSKRVLYDVFMTHKTVTQSTLQSHILLLEKEVKRRQKDSLDCTTIQEEIESAKRFRKIAK